MILNNHIGLYTANNIKYLSKIASVCISQAVSHKLKLVQILAQIYYCEIRIIAVVNHLHSTHATSTVLRFWPLKIN